MRPLVAVAILVMAVTACGEAPRVVELTATPLPPDADTQAAATDPAAAQAAPRDDGDLRPAPDDAVAVDVASEAAPDDGPSAPPSYDAQRAAYLYAAVADAGSADHLTADLVGDEIAELVVAKTTAAGTLDVSLAVWDGQDYTHGGGVTGGSPQRVGTPVARDLTGDGHREILAPFTDAAGPAVLTVAVSGDGGLAVPASCPVPEPTRYQLRLRASRAATTVVLSCGAAVTSSDATVLQWQDGLFRVVAPTEADGDGQDAPDDRGTLAEPPDTADDPGRDGQGQGPDRQASSGRGADPPGQERDGRPSEGDDVPGRGDDPPGRGHGRDKD